MHKIICMFNILLCFTITAREAEAIDQNLEIAEAIDLVLNERRAMIVSTLELTENEEVRFWPEYDDYEQKMRVVIGELSDLMEQLSVRSKPLSEQEAEVLIDKLFSTKNSSIEINREYSQKFRTILPPKKLAILITILFWL